MGECREAGDQRAGIRERGRRRLELLALLCSARAIPVAAFVVVTAAEAVLFPAELAVTGWLVGSVADATAGGAGSTAAGRAEMAVAALGAILLARQVLGPLSVVIGARIRRRIDGELLRRSQAAITGPVGMAHIHDPAVFADLSLGGGDHGPGTDTPGGAAVGMVAQASRYAASLLAGAIVARYSKVAAAAVLVAALAARYHTQRHHSAMLARFRALNIGYRRAGYSASLGITPAAAKEVRLFGFGGWLADRYGRDWGQVTGEMSSVRAGVRSRIARAHAGLLAVETAAVVHLGLMALDGRIAVGALTAAVWGTFRLGALAFATSDDFRVDQGLLALGAVRRLEARAGAEAAVTPPGAGRSAEGMPAGQIRFEAVTFAYPGGERPVLDGLDLTIPAGSSLAVVGANGAGKTTLVKLLGRLYEPGAGRVVVDGVPLADLDPAAWRARLAVIFQDFARYEL
ncbi:MAG: ATP-binding cassette domain-containing protein, partial [Acidimicrobiales bacterium]